MFCGKCQNDLVKCICPDIDERLAKIGNSPNIAFRKCLKCGKHYARCQCDEPKWGISGKKNNKPKS